MIKKYIFIYHNIFGGDSMKENNKKVVKKHIKKLKNLHM